MFIARAAESAERGPRYAPTDVSRAAQTEHLKRLRALKRYPGFAFTSPVDLANYLKSTGILDLLVKAARARDVAGGSNIIVGVPAEKIDELVRERTKPLEDLSASQKETIVLLKDKLDLNERQIRAALETVGEKDIPPERLAAKLIDIAQKFNDLKAASTAQPGDDAEIEALRQQVQAAIDSGDLVRADSVLAQIEMKQRAALDRLALNAAATVGRRGEVALARLHYLDAAKQFGEAARLLPQTHDFS